MKTITMDLYEYQELLRIKESRSELVEALQEEGRVVYNENGTFSIYKDADTVKKIRTGEAYEKSYYKLINSSRDERVIYLQRLDELKRSCEGIHKVKDDIENSLTVKNVIIAVLSVTLVISIIYNII